jgi:hypothetical protein
MMLVVALAMAPCIHADSYTEYISRQGTTFTCTPACLAPYATLEVDLTTDTTATITLTGLDNGTYQYLIGDDSQGAALNVNSTNFTVSGITATQEAGFTSITYTPKYYIASPQGYDSLGYYNLNINGTGSGYNTAAMSISFALTDVSGTWADAAAVLTSVGNDYGYDVAVPIYVCPASNCTSSSTVSEVAHGTAGASPIPEPASILMFGGILLLVGRSLRRRMS